MVDSVHESVEMDMEMKSGKDYSMVTWTNDRSSTGKVDKRHMYERSGLCRSDDPSAAQWA